VRAHPGPRVWVAWPLRGNQEAPSQPGGHARCSSRNTAFVRASWVGPPNRASPMRGFGVAVETCGAVRERVGRRTNQGSVHAGIRTRRLGPCDTSCAHRSLPPTGALPMRGSAIVLGMCGADTFAVGPRGQTGLRPHGGLGCISTRWQRCERRGGPPTGLCPCGHSHTASRTVRGTARVVGRCRETGLRPCVPS
jgi:hypothetical protein